MVKQFVAKKQSTVNGRKQNRVCGPSYSEWREIRNRITSGRERRRSGGPERTRRTANRGGPVTGRQVTEPRGPRPLTGGPPALDLLNTRRAGAPVNDLLDRPDGYRIRLSPAGPAALPRQGPHRIRRCGHGACILHFFDTSRNGRRRWCAMAACGNRAKTARHYERARGQGLRTGNADKARGQCSRICGSPDTAPDRAVPGDGRGSRRPSWRAPGEYGRPPGRGQSSVGAPSHWASAARSSPWPGSTAAQAA
ncbi:CGNR zinc finger domain-containing protein [Kitasatospora sp. NPDC088548]|uniref:CGNR zinc finger domain-containing protein n=1 Tax=Kitasatospora sp. NPDC088548 TaxID=3364075 RepID=UPI0037FDBD53